MPTRLYYRWCFDYFEFFNKKKDEEDKKILFSGSKLYLDFNVKGERRDGI
jgi:hypothetical protein